MRRTLRRASAAELEGMTVGALRERCRELGLPVSGKKVDLIERIVEEGPPVATTPVEAAAPAVSARSRVPPAVAQRTAVRPRGPINEKEVHIGDVVFFKTRTGKYLDFEEHREDLRARGKSKGRREAFIIEADRGGVVQAGDTVYLKVHTGVHVDFVGSAVRARYSDHGDWQRIRIGREEGSGPVMAGDVVFLRGHQDNVLDVEAENVKARWPDEGKWQRLVIEKE